jgi:hypothetical protein
LIHRVGASLAWAGITAAAFAIHSSVKEKCRRFGFPLRLGLALLIAFGIAAGSIASAQLAQSSGAFSVVVSGLVTYPAGVAVDSNGNVYLSDTANKQVLKETLSGGGYTQSVVANSSNGLGGAWGVAVDGSGNVYIADNINDDIWKATPSGGSYSVSAILSGLSRPTGIAVDASGNLYIATTAASEVLKETLSGGSYTPSVVADMTTNGLVGPIAVAVDASGDVYIGDVNDSQVVKETLSGGTYTQTVVANAASNGIDEAYAVAVDASGNVYIGDFLNERLLKETPSAGSYTQTVVFGDLIEPGGVAVNSHGNVYVGGDALFANIPDASVLELTPSGGNSGQVSVGSAGATTMPLVFTASSAGTIGSIAVLTQGAPGLDFTNAGTGTCAAGVSFTTGESCTVNVSFSPRFAGARYGAVELLTGSGSVIGTGYIEGTGVAPQIAFSPAPATAIDPTVNGSGLSYPIGAALDGAGDLFIADSDGTVGVVEVPAGGGAPVAIVPTINSRTLSASLGVAVDGAGNLFTTDGYLVAEVPAGGGTPFAIDATVNGEGLNNPRGVAVDGGGDLFIANSGNSSVVEVPAGGGAATAIVPTVNSIGLGPFTSVAVDGGGDLFIADSLNDRVVEVPAGGGAATAIDPTVNGYGLIIPLSVAVDGVGDLFAGDDLPRVVEVPVGGAVAAIDPTVGGIALSSPQGLVVDGAGDLIIADTYNNRVVELQSSQPPALSFALTDDGSASAPQTITIKNAGNAPLTFTVPATGNNPDVSGDFSVNWGAASSCPELTASSPHTATLAAGAECVLAVSFTPPPTATGTLTGSLTITDTSLNAAAPNYATQSIQLQGIANSAQTLAIIQSPAPGLNTVLGTNNVAFQWTAGTGVTVYQLCLSAVGPGACDLFSHKGAALTASVPSLPANGVTVYATLYSFINGAWLSNSYVYVESGTAVPAVLTFPTPGLSTVLGTGNVLFQWSGGTGVSDYQLNLSAIAPGQSELFLYKGAATSATATSLPANGVAVYARLYSYISGTWQYNDYLYTESGTSVPAILQSPSPGLTTVLGTSNVLFQWTAGTGATLYQLNLSAVAPGGSELFLYKGSATSTSVPSLPANGVKVYARLYSYINKAWEYNDCVYTEQ